MRDVIANNVALQNTGLVSADLQSPMAFFFFFINADYPILTVMAKVVTIELLCKCKVSALQNLNKIDLIFSVIEILIYFPATPQSLNTLPFTFLLFASCFT